MQAPEKQPGIQVARAVAALSIVYYHSWVALTRFPKDTAYQIPVLTTYGWLAVPLFFAISGFVICLVVSRQSFSVPSFLIKRIFRIYPIWLLMLTIFASTAWLWRGWQPRETFGFLLYSATLLPTDGFPFYDLGWTMQHEIAFYLIAAAVVPLFGLVGLAIVLLVSAVAVHLIDMPWYLANISSHHGEFLAGALAFMLRKQTARLGFLLPSAIGIALFTAFAASTHIPLFPVPLFVLITAFANLNPSELTWWRKAATMLGNASYSIYLIHPMVFLVASSAVSKFPNLPIWSEEPIRTACIVVIIATSFLCWRYFETPMIEIGHRLASPPRPVVLEARSAGIKMHASSILLGIALLSVATSSVSAQNAPTFQSSPRVYAQKPTAPAGLRPISPHALPSYRPGQSATFSLSVQA
jgi:exopolysaccharide production protein ExoZ